MSIEHPNPKTLDLDLLDTRSILEAIHREDRRGLNAVQSALPQIATAIDQIVPRVEAGGCILYVASGTSGRLAVLEAVDCPVVFGVDPTLVQALLAGGNTACFEADETIEDDPQRGAADLRRRSVTARDVVIGVTTGGTSLYTQGALRYAASRGILTVAITCEPGSKVLECAQLPIVVDTGPEAVAGATRMKAALAQKMVLNLLTTGVLTRLGYVYCNFPVYLQSVNRRLTRQAHEMIRQVTGADLEEARDLLERAGEVPAAIVMKKFGCSLDEARRRLESADSLRRALGEA